MTLVGAVVLWSTAEMGEDVCSEVRATLRDSIWVSTLELPFISYDPTIGCSLRVLSGCSGLLEDEQSEHRVSDIMRPGAWQLFRPGVRQWVT